MLTIKTFGRAISALALGGQKLNDKAHELGLFALHHAMETGDIRQIDMVYQAMTKGRLRAEGFKYWVENFSPVRWTKKDGVSKIQLSKPASKAFKPWELDHAKANPFWTLEGAAEMKIKEFSLEILQGMLSRALKKAEELNKDGEIVNKDGQVTYKADADKVVQIKNWAADMRATLAKKAA